MDDVLRDFLFSKRFLVERGKTDRDEAFETAFAMARLLGIRITRGAELLSLSVFSYAAKQLGIQVPAPFYRGFPQSVRELTPDQLLFDQLFHYVKTYGFGLFDDPGHSVLERDFVRLAFEENTEPRDFAVLSADEAAREIQRSGEALLGISRPLSDDQFNVLEAAIRGGFLVPDKCASKDTAVRLLLSFRDPSYASFLDLHDFLRLVEELNYREYESKKPRVWTIDWEDCDLCCGEAPKKKKEKDGLRKLNLRNKDRKFLARVLDRLLADAEVEVRRDTAAAPDDRAFAGSEGCRGGQRDGVGTDGFDRPAGDVSARGLDMQSEGASTIIFGKLSDGVSAGRPGGQGDGAGTDGFDRPGDDVSAGGPGGQRADAGTDGFDRPAGDVSARGLDMQSEGAGTIIFGKLSDGVSAGGFGRPADVTGSDGFDRLTGGPGGQGDGTDGAVCRMIRPSALEACFERKALWSGVLHHLHYRPRSGAAEVFVRQMRGRENYSVSSRFEAALAAEGPAAAARILGSGALVLRHLQYLLSRCASEEEADRVLDSLDSENVVVLLQLLYQYVLPEAGQRPRTFCFTRHNLLKVHIETEDEVMRRKSRISPVLRERTAVKIRQMLVSALSGRLEKVYIDPAMRKIAVPIQENASQTGFGILPKGSRLPIPEGKKLRAFTYWEKVNDIDLSAIGLLRPEAGGNTPKEDPIIGGSDNAPASVPRNPSMGLGGSPEACPGEGCLGGSPEACPGDLPMDQAPENKVRHTRQVEFSWRTMYENQSEAITFSGDETSGYKGGSEYFDIDLDAFRKKYPDIDVIIFCNNVYSRTPFSECICRAGYMLRDTEDSGEIFEPKTVDSSFTVNCESTFAFLFALDLRAREFVWLNLARSGSEIVAGEDDLSSLEDYLHRTEIFSVYDLFACMAREITDDPAAADLIVSDRSIPDVAPAKLLRSCDIDRIAALL